MWLSSWFGHYYSKTQQMTHKHQNAKFFGGQGNHRFLSNFLNTPCNSEFQTTHPLTFQIFISESNHILTLAFEQSCFLPFLIQGNLTKIEAAQFNDLTKARITLWAKIIKPSSQTKGTSAESFDFVSVSRQRVRFLYNILSLD